MTKWAQKYEGWLRAHLPEELRSENIDFFGSYYLNGLTVMTEGERGGPDTVVFDAKNEDELRYFMLETVCTFVKEVRPRENKTWRYYRDHAEDGKWFYVERRRYDYNAIEDPRLWGFECFLRNAKYGLPADRWEKLVRSHVALMNRWYRSPHWDYDRGNLCFIEISDSKEHDGPGTPEEPRPGSVVKVID